ncbi:MAG: YdeI/OmpD-associated family protein [Chitinophagaceae bacterium]|nr:YdeI/OmpD-associated family protein [Chitinophagaceae bacterium]
MRAKADFFFDNEGPWQQEYAALRDLIQACHLEEDLKWGCPCYTFNGKNVVLIHGFKEYCAVLFFKGALLKDPKKVLIQQTENVQAARQMRFTSLQQVKKLASALKAYVLEATSVEEAGLKVPLKQTKDYSMPEEFQSALDNDAALKTAFEALTPGRQRAYLFHFSQAKQAKTRVARIEKYIPQILDGKGMDDE